MTQKELIEFCKENDPNYNKDASFKVLEPMWSIPKGVGGIGITESEFKNGFYVQIDTKGRKGFEHLEGKVYYFQSSVFHELYPTYNSHWKKYFVSLTCMDGWGKEVVKKVVEGKGIIEQIEDPFIKYTPRNIENFTEFMKGIVPVGPYIQKIHMQTVYKNEKSKTSMVVTKSSVEGRIMLSISEEEEIEDIDDYYKFSFTKERFSDLVDLMIEARKDLEK